jgi:hypothetical protein
LVATVCGVPLEATIVAAEQLLQFVKAKLAEVAPAAVATTVYDPPTPLAVNKAEVAIPDALVTAVFTPPAKVPLAPDGGGENVTVTPPTAVWPEFWANTTTSGAENVPLVGAVCGVPLSAERAGGMQAQLISEKLAGEEAPGTDAVTV